MNTAVPDITDFFIPPHIQFCLPTPQDRARICYIFISQIRHFTYEQIMHLRFQKMYQPVLQAFNAIFHM